MSNTQASASASEADHRAENGGASLPNNQAEIDRRIEVLKGAFSSAFSSSFQEGDKSWRSPHWKLQVFVSSTFTDTMLERDILMKEIQPALREKARSEGVEVTLVDMRWGVRDENTLDHRTWIDCWVELERCRVESRGLFFLSLQSDKYENISLLSLFLPFFSYFFPPFK